MGGTELRISRPSEGRFCEAISALKCRPRSDSSICKTLAAYPTTL